MNKSTIIKVDRKFFRVVRQNGVTEVFPLDKGYTGKQIVEAAGKAHKQWKIA